MLEFKRILDNYRIEKNFNSSEEIIEEIEFLKTMFFEKIILNNEDRKKINEYILEKCITLICEHASLFGKEIPLFYLSYIEKYSDYLKKDVLDLIIKNPHIHKKIDFVFLRLDKNILMDIWPLIVENGTISLIEKIKEKHGVVFLTLLFEKNINLLKTFSIDKIKWILNSKLLSSDEKQIFLKNIVDVDNNKNDEVLKIIKKEFFHLMTEKTFEFYNNSLFFKEILNAENKNQLTVEVKKVNLENIFNHRTLNNSNILHYLFKSQAVSYFIQLWNTKKFKNIINELLKEKNEEGFTPLDYILESWDYIDKLWKIKEIFYINSIFNHPTIDLLHMTNRAYEDKVKEILNILMENNLLLDSFDFSTHLSESNYNDILKISDIIEPYLFKIIERNMNLNISEKELIFLTTLICFMNNTPGKSNLYKVDIMKNCVKNSANKEEFLNNLPAIRKKILSCSDLSQSQLKEYYSVKKVNEMNDMIKITKEYFKMREIIKNDELNINKKRL